MIKFIPKQKEETKPVTHKVGQCYIDKDGDVIMLCWMDGKGNFLQIISGQDSGGVLGGKYFAFNANNEYQLSQEEFESLRDEVEYRLTPINIEIHEV